jgi:hypothetical protein
VKAKVADLDIKGAVKLLSSDDSLASFNEDVAEKLKKNILHHLANFFTRRFQTRTRRLFLIVNEQNVREAINSCPAGSSPGLDNMRPKSLKDIISLSAGEAGQQALRALTKLSGQLYGLRRLTSKLACFQSRNIVNSYFSTSTWSGN